MLKTTDLKEVKRTTKYLLMYPVSKCLTEIPFVIIHPFTNSPFVMINKSEMIDITIEENEEKWKNYMIQILDDEKIDLISVYCMINKPYLLVWFDLIKKYLSEEDYAKYLAAIWVSSEDPNQDKNVSIRGCISLFKKAKKEYLMEKKDKEVYDNIPNKITLYRGVSIGRNPYGLSYTASLDKAEWFKNRFGQEGVFIITLEVDRKDILAYFNTRNEDEYVVNINNYRDKIKEQIP